MLLWQPCVAWLRTKQGKSKLAFSLQKSTLCFVALKFQGWHKGPLFIRSTWTVELRSIYFSTCCLIYLSQSELNGFYSVAVQRFEADIQQGHPKQGQRKCPQQKKRITCPLLSHLITQELCTQWWMFYSQSATGSKMTEKKKHDFFSHNTEVSKLQ